MSPQEYARSLRSKILVTTEEVEKRLAICNTCPNKKEEYLTKIILCDLCGCVISLKTKINGQKCPINKW